MEPVENKTAKNTKFVLACSGASDLGEITDKVARKLRNSGLYQMKCLAMVAAERTEIVETLKSAETLVIDGCPIDCGRKIMEEAWLTNYQYVRLTDLGYIKGKTPVTDQVIEEVYNQIMDGTSCKTIEQDKLIINSGNTNCNCQ